MSFPYESPSLIDRIVAVLSYYSFGLVGLVWLVICTLAKKPLNSFILYHIYQSIFLSVCLYILSLFLSIAFGFMSAIPIIGGFVKAVNMALVATPVYFSFTLTNFAIFVVITYLALFALLGKYSYFPGISDIIGSNFRR